MRTLIIVAIGLALAGCKSSPPTETEDRRREHAHAEHKGDHFDHRFEKADDWAKVFDDPERDKWQKPDHVATVIGLAEGMTVADIGAGTGYFLAAFSRAVGSSGKVIGLDIEPDMVRYMNERAKREALDNVTARVVATDDPGLVPASIDRVVLVNTWHHIPERAAYTEKLKQALKPGGAVAIVDYTKEAPRGPPAAHRLTPAEVVAELEAGGLVAEVLVEELPLQYVVIGRLND